MIRVRTVLAGRRHVVAPAVATAAVTALVWTASSFRPAGTAEVSGSAGPAGVRSVCLATTGARDLPGPWSLPGPWCPPGARYLPGRLPTALRADLGELVALRPTQRQRAAARIRQDALKGAYGARIRLAAGNSPCRFTAPPAQHTYDIRTLGVLNGYDRVVRRAAIRAEALSGGHGRQVRRRARAHGAAP
ncbi:hypothetical protein ACIRPX_21135 [Streptomyces sp. NPDC101225]|uniref:hypothetical protein n=1 Tax=Streptomyces sp. NPDC101225 TaxID=3366135 RepID=UPI003802E7EA